MRHCVILHFWQYGIVGCWQGRLKSIFIDLTPEADAYDLLRYLSDSGTQSDLFDQRNGSGGLGWRGCRGCDLEKMNLGEVRGMKLEQHRGGVRSYAKEVMT